ncbi:MAG: hypothetical protein AMXMBFR64_07230 [Myxococcales bacterium]
MAEHRPIGPAKHKGEQSGIDFLVKGLPPDYLVVTNVDLPAGRIGRFYEHDAVVVAPHAVFTVELKSWGGAIAGNRDRWTLADGIPRQSPIPLTLDKARTLKGGLAAHDRALRDVWVQGLVFVSGPDATLELGGSFASVGRTRADVVSALTDPAAWGLEGQRLTAAQRRAVERTLLDGQAPAPRTHLGQYRLIERLPSEGRPHDAWLGEDLLGERRVLHVYPTDGGDERARQRARVHALREASLLDGLRGGPDLLRYMTYVVLDAPPAIALVFEDTARLLPLPAWVERTTPGLGDRLRVAARLARALDWVHCRGVVHRALSPASVLVSDGAPPTDLRVCSFELARDLSGRAATITSSALAASDAPLAPETLRTGEATARSDLFAFGAVLVELLSGRPLFERPEDALRPVDLPPVEVDGVPAPPTLRALLLELLAPEPSARPASAAAVAEVLDALLAAPAGRRPLARGEPLTGPWELVEALGGGAGGAVWRVRHRLLGSTAVAKIAGPDQAPMLDAEATALQAVAEAGPHPNVVGFRDLLPVPAGRALLVEDVAGVDAAVQAGAGDPLAPDALRRFADGLLAGLERLHATGLLHRDVKPSNVLLRADGAAVLIDLGLACTVGTPGELTVGSPAYKDPLLWQEGCWTELADLYAAWLVVAEVLTGAHPFDDRPAADPAWALDPAMLPDALPAPAASALAALITDALGPDPGRRPATAAAARARLAAALGAAAGAAVDAAAPALTPEPSEAALGAGTPIATLPLSARARSALARLGVSTVGEVPRVAARLADPALRNVGRKTRAELLALAARAATLGPGTPAEPPPAPSRGLCPALSGDERPLDALGAACTAAVERGLGTLGVTTVGQLAATPRSALTALPGVAAKKIDALARALDRLAGAAAPPATLADLAARLRAELKSTWDVVSALAGAADGVARRPSDVAALLGVTRQAVDAAMDRALERLRAPASAAAWLAGTVEDVLPRAGFAPVEDVAAGLGARLPPGPDAHPLGFARLAAVLLSEAPSLTDAPRLELVARAPLTLATVAAARDAVAAACGWPPLAYDDAAAVALAALPDVARGALRRFGADASALLAALLRLLPDVRRTDDGALMTPPESLAAVLAWLRPRLQTGVTPAALLDLARAAVPGTPGPADDEELLAALAAVGLARRDGLVVEADAPLPVAPTAPVVDPEIPRQVVRDGGGVDVSELVSAARLGGFRVVALPPARHHVLADRLTGALRAALPDGGRVRQVDVDRTILAALRAGGLWEEAVFREGHAKERWTWAHEPLLQALDAAALGLGPGEDPSLAEARPGVVTVLARPALLGTLGLVRWLSGFYERARGGRYGLFVLALPGGVHDGRVRLNERHPFAYTPDMAAFCLVPDA